MRHIRIFAITLVAVALFAVSGNAQKKTTKKPAVKKPVPSTVKTVQPLEVRTAREKVDIQLSNVNTFVNAMGPIVQQIEALEASAKAKPLPKKTADIHETNKEKLVAAIRKMKDTLADLEAEFRTKPALQKYLIKIEGITDLGAKSEDTAIAGKYVASKEPLRDVAKKLTDTLAAIPL